MNKKYKYYKKKDGKNKKTGSKLFKVDEHTGFCWRNFVSAECRKTTFKAYNYMKNEEKS